MRIVDWSSDVCSSDLGADPTREVPEDLVGLEALVAPRQLSVLVVGGVEHDIELPAGVDDVPGLHRRVPVVAPVELVAELGEATVHEEAVLGVARALGPLRAELEPDHPVTGPPRSPAPVPRDLRRPATPDAVEHAPGDAGGAAAGVAVVADHQLSHGGPGRWLHAEDTRTK